MKTKSDPRHLQRIKKMQELFTWEFQSGSKPTAEIYPIVAELNQIDALIAESASDRPIEQINKIDLAILRLAIFEIIIKKDAPLKVVIDEAIELGKEFGADSSPSFINGVLGKLIQRKGIKE